MKVTSDSFCFLINTSILLIFANIRILFSLSLQDLILVVGLECTSPRTMFLYYFSLVYDLFIVVIFGLEIQ